MKGLIAFSAAMLFTVGAFAAPADDQKKILTTCGRVVVASHMLLNSKPDAQQRLADDLRVHLDDYSRGLSDLLPQMYNSVHTGLNTVLELQALNTPSSASNADRAAVIGLWCVQDTVYEMSKSSRLLLQEQETQVEIINLYSKMVNRGTH